MNVRLEKSVWAVVAGRGIGQEEAEAWGVGTVGCAGEYCVVYCAIPFDGSIKA